jgi:diacylglycerol kinase (ATP)
MLIAPDASLCDGLLDIFVLSDVGKRALLFSLLPRVLKGKHVGRPGVLHLKGATARVTSPVEMLVELDGEPIGRAPLEVSVVPRVLRVVGHAEALAKAGGCAG